MTAAALVLRCHYDTWRDATTDPPALGSLVLIRLDDGEVRTIRWSERAGVRFRWWVPREALPA